MLRPVVVTTVLIAFSPQFAAAQTAAAPRNSEKDWHFDAAGTVGVSPGIGVPTTALALNGAFTFVRSTHPDEFSHRCWGITTVVNGLWGSSSPDFKSPRERGVLVGPRWDTG